MQKKLVQVPDAQRALIPRQGEPVGSLNVLITLLKLGTHTLKKQALGAGQLAVPQMYRHRLATQMLGGAQLAVEQTYHQLPPPQPPPQPQPQWRPPRPPRPPQVRSEGKGVLNNF